jgi:hypothetical protein
MDSVGELCSLASAEEADVLGAHSIFQMAAVTVQAKCKHEEELAFMWSLVVQFTDMSELVRNVDACIATLHTDPYVKEMMYNFKTTLEKHANGSDAAAVHNGHAPPQKDIFKIANLILTLLKLIIQILTNDAETIFTDLDLALRRLDRVLIKLECVQKFFQIAYEGWQTSQKNQEDFFMHKYRKLEEKFEVLQRENAALQVKMQMMEEEEKKTEEYAEWVVCRKQRRNASETAN